MPFNNFYSNSTHFYSNIDMRYYRSFPKTIKRIQRESAVKS